MNTDGDAAEQVVRMSLEGVEVAARITGYGAKNTAILLATVLKQEQKTKGKARLTSMLKSGKPLKVFSVQQKDLQKFSQEAKRYGVLYCVLKDRSNTSEHAMVDVIARADDASKIQRITDRFKLATIDTAQVIGNVEKAKGQMQQEWPPREERQHGPRIMGQSGREDTRANPGRARTEREPLSVRSSNEAGRSDWERTDRDPIPTPSKPSVKAKLDVFRQEQEAARRERAKAMEKTQQIPEEVLALLKTVAKDKEKIR